MSNETNSGRLPNWPFYTRDLAGFAAAVEDHDAMDDSHPQKTAPRGESRFWILEDKQLNAAYALAYPQNAEPLPETPPVRPSKPRAKKATPKTV